MLLVVLPFSLLQTEIALLGSIDMCSLFSADDPLQQTLYIRLSFAR